MPTVRLAFLALLLAFGPMQAARAATSLELGYARLGLQERYAIGGSETSIPWIDAYQVIWRQEWHPDWGTTVKLSRWGSYMVEDATIDGSNHVRTETRASVSADRLLVLGPTRHRLAFGYQGRLVQVANSFAAPAPLYLFSELQAFHGASLGDRVTLPLLGGLGVFADISAVPYALSHLGPGIPALGPMFGASSEVGLEHDTGSGHVRLSYRHELLRRYEGPFQQIAGPALSIGCHF